MIRFLLLLVCVLICSNTYAQKPLPSEKDSLNKSVDSIKQQSLIKHIGNGYLPSKFVNIDLRYLFKFNQFEGFRTGLGGITNKNFSDKFRIDTYLVYGFRDNNFKYNLGFGVKVASKTNTWLHASYTDDLTETGSSGFLTDKRFFQFFEPRLLNIDLFHKHETKAFAIEHQISKHLLSETEFANSKIEPTYNYAFILNDKAYSKFILSTFKISLQWSPFSDYEFTKDGLFEINTRYPKFTMQYTQGFNGVIDSDFQFTKLDLRIIHKITHANNSRTEAALVSGIAIGDTPLTHLYHAYPNNINKETVMQRFSVAGTSSFETMYFNEFFSDKFTTAQLKHIFNRFKVTERFRPELVLITRFAIGEMSNISRHQPASFNTLDHGYFESGFEINRILLGFGLSFAYRYGAYHLDNFEDNFALKFTFNISL
ncbi:MAG: hypothetical protein BM564_06710 [Bacteroidetes bacterium MedPE-SWsnd-G2]|nr:MAG: hypothetical protein BM564_06710 [Bacteroidetes bacterium MedPE-SWsnd-G2]